MKAHWGFGLILSLFTLFPVAAQESREAYLAGLRAAVKNPADSQDVYRRLIDPQFRTILTDAAKKGDQALVKELLSAYFGGNPSQFSALGLAAAFGDAAIVKALLEHGADPKASNGEQYTPLHSAADDDGDAEILKILLDKGVDPNARTFVGTTPLMLAAESDANQNVRALLLVGAKVNARTDDGETALMRAVKGNGLETVRILLQAGANPRLKDENGKLASNFLVKEPFVPSQFRRNIGGFTSEERKEAIEVEQRENRKQIAALLQQAMTPPISALAISSDGKTLLSGDLNGEVQIWDTTTGKKLHTLIPNEKIVALELSPDGRQITVGCENRDTQIWEKQGAQFRTTRSVPSKPVPAKAFSADEKTLKIWNALKDNPKQNITLLDVNCMTVLWKNNALATGDKQGKITLWNVETGAKRFQTRLSDSPIRAMSNIPQTSLIAVSCDDGGLLLWDSATKTTKQLLIKPAR